MKANGASREVYAAGTIHPTKKGDVKVIEFKSSREVVVQFLTEGQEITTVQAIALRRGSVSRKKQVRSKVAANSGAEVICNRCGTTDESIIGYDKARHNDRALNCKPCANELKSGLVQTPYGLIGKIRNMEVFNSKTRGHAAPKHSTQELYQWALNNKLMHYFNIWKVKGYPKYYRPSIDRINSDEPYTLSNMRLMTWRNNQHLGFMDKSVGYKLQHLDTKEVTMVTTKEQAMDILHIRRNQIPNSGELKLRGYLVTPLSTPELCEGTIRVYPYESTGVGKLFENAETCCKEMGISENDLIRSLKTFEPLKDWCYYHNATPRKVDCD